MNSIKITLWIQLIIYSLNALLRIRISGVTLFDREHAQKCVNRSCNPKKRRLTEGKCNVPKNENHRYQSDRILILQIFC